jgi:CRISPR/Cas system-associated exonuclease Cas4 (RecB family)
VETITETLLKRLTQVDNLRSRSTQVEVGPSEIGGCSRRLWYRINNEESSNKNTLRLSAIMGTAIHAAIEKAFDGAEDCIVEQAFTHEGITGHIDLMVRDGDGWQIWDWKTTTKNSLSYFGSHQQKAQVQLYGWLAQNNGYKVTSVGLVGIARDGNEDDIVELVMPYSEKVATEALAQLDAVKRSFEPPAPEKDVSFCEKYCEFFGTCSGIVSPDVADPITNSDVLRLVSDYKALQAESKKIDADLDFIKSALEGTTGTTPDGITVKWSQVAGRQSIDEAAVEAALGYVPKKQGSGYARLVVK